jgi:hypothetical protein
VSLKANVVSQRLYCQYFKPYYTLLLYFHVVSIIVNGKISFVVIGLDHLSTLLLLLFHGVLLLDLCVC